MSLTLVRDIEQEAVREQTALIMAGRPVASEIRKRCIEEITVLRDRFGLLPGLTVVRIGDDPASISYTERITQSFSSAGLTVKVDAFSATISRAMLQAELGRLSSSPEIAGIIVQMPLPTHLGLQDVVDVLDPDKDVDGIHPVNAGRLALGLACYAPATPAGGIALLDFYHIPIEGERALVIGRSDVVGRPLAQLLIARNATVTVAHSRTRDLPALVRESDIVACAVGRPEFVRGSWIKPGATILDFGASMVSQGPQGDVEYDAAVEVARAITPVPGGTGPVTNAMLLRNTVQAIRHALKA